MRDIHFIGHGSHGIDHRSCGKCSADSCPVELVRDCMRRWCEFWITTNEGYSKHLIWVVTPFYLYFVLRLSLKWKKCVFTLFVIFFLRHDHNGIIRWKWGPDSHFLCNYYSSETTGQAPNYRIIIHNHKCHFWHNLLGHFV